MYMIGNLRDVIYRGDPELRSWPLVTNDYLPFILAFMYNSMCYFGPKIMKDRKPFDLRNLMIVFNFSIVVAYIGEVFAILYYIRLVPWEYNCKGVPVFVKGEPAYMVASACWVFYVLKMIEYGDTLFFILRKKNNQVTFLHVVHHTVMPIITWVMLRAETNAFQVFPALANGLVHIVMYSYYGLAAMGPEVRKYLWWKKYLTQMQMIQFVLITLVAAVIAPMFGCPMVIGHVIDTFFGPFFLVLFLRFYITTFKSKAEKVN